MLSMGKCVAVIVAAGKGVRMGNGVRKQYRILGDRPVLARTLSLFHKRPEIDNIVLVVPEADRSFCRNMIIEPSHLEEKTELVSGGSCRQESVYNGLQAAGGDCSIVLIHDAVRPFASARLIAESMAGAVKYGACIAAVRARDTLKVVRNNTIRQTLSRDEVWMAQTPQAFQYDIIMKAHETAREKRFKGTDDAALVEHSGIEVHVIEGDARNIKITLPEDLEIAEALLGARKKGKG